MKADYVYRNADDTKRIKIFKVFHDDTVDQFHWDVDIWDRETDSYINYADYAGDAFNTKRDAKYWAEEQCGKIISMGNIETVTEGWK